MTSEHQQYTVDQVQEAVKRGAVTDSYAAEPEFIVDTLNQLRSTEFTSYLQYMQHSYMAVSLMSPRLKDEFQAHASQELQHADRLATRIQQLGGIPIFQPRDIAVSAAESGAVPKQGTTLTEMVAEDLMLERRQIDAYRDTIRKVGDTDLVTRHLLIGILGETETHASELADYLKRASDAKS